jgi:erythritol transport system ATP-binding protein
MSVYDSPVIFEARGITKRYPGTVALQSATFRVYRNQVNVLIGENGAGKSTLMRILAGVERADEGELILEGSIIEPRSPRDAAKLGITIVHQELSILPNLDIAENIFAGREPSKAGFILDRATEEVRSVGALRRLRKPMDVSIPAIQLSLGCRQLVEVARAIDQNTKILLLDEPTSALSNGEAGSLFDVIAELKHAGVTIIYISHRLNELLHLGDYFTVLRSGRVVGEARRSEVSRQWIVERMSGGEPTTGLAPFEQNGAELLRIDGLTVSRSSPDEVSQSPLHGFTLSLKQGEILGIYGLLGAGRTELLEAIAGLRTRSAGDIFLNGKLLQLGSVRDAVKAGIFLVPEDRQRDGLFPGLSIRENIAVAALRGIVLDRAAEVAQARRLAQELRIAATDLELPVTALSGGNQQKVLIARCLMSSPRVLLLDEPTRGVDVRAKAEIYAILRQLANKGVGIIFTSSEIEETQTLADRALVLCQGRLSAEFNRSALTDEALFAAASPVIATSVTTTKELESA